ncbi:hypothetical protein SSPIM334S_08099 [Streptomyces spiroverticillatus]
MMGIRTPVRIRRECAGNTGEVVEVMEKMRATRERTGLVPSDER